MTKKNTIAFIFLIMLLVSAGTSTKSRFVLEETTEQVYKVNNAVIVKSIEKFYKDTAPEDHAFMKINTTEYTTQSGKKFIIRASATNYSYLDLMVTTKSFFPNNEYTHSLENIDPIVDIWYTDLNSDGYNEWFIITRNIGSGGYGNLFGYISDEDTRVVHVEIPPLTERETMGGYMGHDTFHLETKDFGKVEIECYYWRRDRSCFHPHHEIFIIREFPLYNEGDGSVNPSGGRVKIQYSLMKQNENFVLTPVKVYYRQQSSWKIRSRKEQ